MSFEGTIFGGAAECIPTEDGWYAPPKSQSPMQCDPGTQPDKTRTSCEQCTKNEYNPSKGGTCWPCPSYTYPNENKTECVPFDLLHTQDAIVPIHKTIRPDLFCLNPKHTSMCDNNNIGPIYFNPEEIK